MIRRYPWLMVLGFVTVVFSLSFAGPTSVRHFLRGDPVSISVSKRPESSGAVGIYQVSIRNLTHRSVWIQGMSRDCDVIAGDDVFGRIGPFGLLSFSVVQPRDSKTYQSPSGFLLYVNGDTNSVILGD